MSLTWLIVAFVVFFLFVLLLIGVNRPAADGQKFQRPPEPEEGDFYEPGDNRVIGYDGRSTLLVEARSIWNITGNHLYDLPAHVFHHNRWFRRSGGKYIVAFHGHLLSGRPVHGKFYKATGRVMPKRKGDALVELMLGSDHVFAHVKLLEPVSIADHYVPTHLRVEEL